MSQTYWMSQTAWWMLVGCLGFATSHARSDAEAAEPRDLLENSSRIVFLGDSITYTGHYVAYFDAWLLTQDFDERPTVINMGLPSETVSGLSEDGHAGGKFPRPDLAERLDRVLEATKPDLVCACYGINCGIYEPFDEVRFQKYRKGITTLEEKAEAAGAQVVLVTPPLFDDARAKRNFSYNAVLDRYSHWLMCRRENGWRVIDLHTAMAEAVKRRREQYPDFTFQRDAVHPDAAGHWVMAREIIRWFGDEAAANADSPEAMLEAKEIPADVLPLVFQRMAVRRDAYLSAAGHKRPGIRPGLPAAEAEKRAAEIGKAISAALLSASTGVE